MTGDVLSNAALGQLKNDRAEIDVSDSSLYRCVKDTATDTTRILIAYRSVTLLPSSLSGSAIAPPEGSVRLPLPVSGKDATKHIRIHAENLYLVAGSTFEFPSKTVIVTANRVVLFSSPAVGGDNVVFDCTGADGDNIMRVGTPGKDGADGGEKRTKIFSGGMGDASESEPTQAEAGGSGTQGEDCGNDGAPGGTFVLNARSITQLPDANNPQRRLGILIKCNGGRGGRGGDGGAGGNGGNGAVFPTEAPSPFNQIIPKLGEGVDGKAGGNGGKGGKGAGGGIGGLVLNIVEMPQNEIEDANSGSWFLRTEVKGGEAGQGGRGGAGGSGGNEGRAYLDLQMFRDPRSGTPSRVGARGEHGKGGDPGESGRSGMDGHVIDPFDGVESLKLHQHAKAFTKECRAETLDVVQLTMAMERLMFEYSILLSGYAVTPDDPDATPAVERFKKEFRETFEWLMQCFDDVLYLSKQGSPHTLPDSHELAKYVSSTAYQALMAYQQNGWKQSAVVRSRFLEAFTIFRSRCSTAHQRDLYGQDVKFISQPNIHLTAVDEALKLLGSIEDSYQQCLKALDQKIDEKTVKARSEEQLRSVVNEAKKKIDTLQSRLSSEYTAVKSARGAVQEARHSVKTSIEKLWAKYKASISSDLGPVLEAISTVCLFAHPGVGAAFKVGSALAIGLGLEKMGSSVDTPQGTVSRDALHGKVLVVENNLVSTALKEDIVQKTISLQKLSGVDKEYVNSVMVNRKNFEDLVNTYFMDASKHNVPPEEVKQVRKDFDAYVETVQKFHKAVISYNDLFTSLAQAEAAKGQAEHGVSKLQVTNFDDEIPTLDLLTTLYRSLHHAAKLETLRILFDAAKAASCVFLRQCDLLHQLFSLGTWSNVSARLLHDVTIPALYRQVAEYKTSFNSKPPVLIEGKTISITLDGKHKGLVERFRETRRFSLFLDDASATGAFDFDINWYDIRLVDLQVYFHGATNPRATSNVDTRTIDVGVQLGGVFFVHDDKYRQYTFEVPSTDVTFEYKYGDEAGREKLEPKSKGGINSALTQFSFALGQVHDVSLDFATPVRSPYMHYVFTVGDHVEVKDVDEIEIKMNLRVRTGQRPKGFKVGSVVVTPSAFSVLG